MKSILITLFLFITSTGYLSFTVPSVSTKPQDTGPEIIIRDKNNRVISDGGVSASDASTLIIQIRSNNKDDAFVIQSGKIYIPNQEPKSFTGPRITANVTKGTVTISIDKLLKRLVNGTFEEVKLGSKFVSFEVKGL